MMRGRWASSGPAGASGTAPPLSAAARSALLRALDEEYRAEALYAHVVDQLGARPPMAVIARAERRHAWALESLALAHGVDLPVDAWATAKQPDFTDVPTACRAGVDSETKTIAMYDELLKGDLPADLRRVFTHLRAASAERHLVAFQGCR